eukprot:SAG31_NODE_3263_length_4482_cov_2.276067_1_plen_760_part_10
MSDSIRIDTTRPFCEFIADVAWAGEDGLNRTAEPPFINGTYAVSNAPCGIWATGCGEYGSCVEIGGRQDCRCWHGFTSSGTKACSVVPEDEDYAQDLDVTYSITWQFGELESPMVEYEWGIGSYWGGWDVIELTKTKSKSVGITNWADIGEEGVFYYAVVRGQNAAGMINYCVSDKIKWDSSKPIKRPGRRTVKDGDSSDIDYVGQRTIEVNWAGLFFDPESGLSHYEVTLYHCGLPADGIQRPCQKQNRAHCFCNNSHASISAGIQLNQSWQLRRHEYQQLLAEQSLGNGTAASPTLHVPSDAGERAQFPSDFVLPSGSRVFAVIVAVNNAKQINVAHSDGVLVDNTPPTFTFSPIDAPYAIMEGAILPNDTAILRDIEWQRTRNTIYAAWMVTEFETDITAVSMQVTTADGDVVLPYTTVAPLTTTVGALSVSGELEHNTAYVTTILASNRAGLAAAASTNGFRVDFTPPQFSITIITEPAGPLREQGILHVHYTVMDPESGVDTTPGEIQIGIGHNPGSADVTQMWINISNTTGVWSTELMNFTNGLYYYASMKARNKVGGLGVGWSDGLICDRKPPYTGRAHVLDGAGPRDADYQVMPKAIAKWMGFVDLNSGIERYYVSLLQGNNIVGWIDAGLSLEARFDVNLVPGLEYRTVVYVVDNVGQFANKTSDGFVFDNTPPDISGPAIVPRFWRSTYYIPVEWPHFNDTESSVAYYEVDFGTGTTEDRVEDTHPRRRVPSQPGTTNFVELAMELTHGI